MATRRMVALAAVLLVAGVAVGVTLANLGSSRVRTPGHATARHSGAPGPATGAGTLPKPVRRAATQIGSVSLVLREPSTPPIANGHLSSGAPVRLLPTKVRFPKAASGSGAPLGAPFPLIVFSQGFDESAGAYAGLLDAWVRAGYVVAAPTYPFTDPSSGTELNENDIVNHPADLHFVIAALARVARAPSSPLHNVLDPTRVAVAGQSDGGDVSLAVAANSCCRDQTVRAAVILSGAELASFGGTYYGNGSVPLLVTQGSQDTINPPGCSAKLYDEAPQPKYYLSISGAEHLPPYVAPGSIRTGVERVTIAFLNAYVKHGASSAGAIGAVGGLPPSEQLTSDGTAPPPTSAFCPGAP